MVVVPASFLSQEWINMVSMKPSQRHFNAVATGKRIHDTLANIAHTYTVCAMLEMPI